MEQKYYVQPLAMVRGCSASEALEKEMALPLAGTGLAFSMIKIISRQGQAERTEEILPVSRLKNHLTGLSNIAQQKIERLIENISRPRDLSRLSPRAEIKVPLIQGILNVTPDSFSDGGQFHTQKQAQAHAEALIEAGADILDIGGESTRPGAAAVSLDEEIGRVIPVVEKLRHYPVPLSLDSRNAAVMARAIKAGAKIINDVSALSHDKDSLALMASVDCPVILMHMLSTPDLMQQQPVYDDVLLDIYDYLQDRIETCVRAGISRERIIVDPGIGFGKTLEHNLTLLADLSLFHTLGTPILLGVSRKSFIAKASRGEEADQRLAGSLATAQAAYDQGIQIIRVHDVAETRQALNLWQSIGYYG